MLFRSAWTPDRFHGREAMPVIGWDCVTVPGVVDAWVKLSERFGKLPFEQLFEPAIQYASSGFAVTPIIADAWSSAVETYRDYPEFCRTFLPGGQSPNAGDHFRRSEEHTSELQSRTNLVCRLLLEKKKQKR